LYHEKEHLGNSSGGSPAGMIIRKALMQAKDQWQGGEEPVDEADAIVFTTKTGDGPFREDLLADHFALQNKQDKTQLITRKGYNQFEITRACHVDGDERKSWWQKSGDQWSIFVRAKDGESGDVTLNPIIIRFARRYAKKIIDQPPLHTKEDIEDWCIQKGLLSEAPLPGAYLFALLTDILCVRR
jgi:hypothetical protein